MVEVRLLPFARVALEVARVVVPPYRALNIPMQYPYTSNFLIIRGS